MPCSCGRSNCWCRIPCRCCDICSPGPFEQENCCKLCRLPVSDGCFFEGKNDEACCTCFLGSSLEQNDEPSASDRRTSSRNEAIPSEVTGDSATFNMKQRVNIPRVHLKDVDSFYQTGMHAQGPGYTSLSGQPSLVAVDQEMHCLPPTSLCVSPVSPTGSSDTLLDSFRYNRTFQELESSHRVSFEQTLVHSGFERRYSPKTGEDLFPEVASSTKVVRQPEFTHSSINENETFKESSTVCKNEQSTLSALHSHAGESSFNTSGFSSSEVTSSLKCNFYPPNSNSDAADSGLLPEMIHPSYSSVETLRTMQRNRTRGRFQKIGPNCPVRSALRPFRYRFSSRTTPISSRSMSAAAFETSACSEVPGSSSGVTRPRETRSNLLAITEENEVKAKQVTSVHLKQLESLSIRHPLSPNIMNTINRTITAPVTTRPNYNAGLHQILTPPFVSSHSPLLVFNPSYVTSRPYEPRKLSVETRASVQQWLDKLPPPECMDLKPKLVENLPTAESTSLDRSVIPHSEMAHYGQKRLSRP